MNRKEHRESVCRSKRPTEVSWYHAEFGPGFAYVAAHREEHRTPGGSVQAFTYCLCRRAEPSATRHAEAPANPASNVGVAS